MSQNNIYKLSKPEKKVVAKVLRKNKYSSTEIEKWLGISDTSVMRAEKEETPNDLKVFEEKFKIAVEQKKKEGLGMVLRRIQEIIPEYPRLDHLVKAGEWFEGKNTSVTISGDKVIAVLGNLKAE